MVLVNNFLRHPCVIHQTRRLSENKITEMVSYVVFSEGDNLGSLSII